MKNFILIFVLIFSFNLYSQITIDGNLNEGAYQVLASKENLNSGFGPFIDVTQILYYVDNQQGKLHLGLKCRLDNSNNNGIGLWINLTGTGSPTGTPAGNSLGIPGAGGHYIGATNGQFKADFEVDYMFAINPGSSSDHCYVDAAKRVGTPEAKYLGDCGQTGTPYTHNTTGQVFPSGYSIQFAFDNSNSNTTGFEIAIPLLAIGASTNMGIEAFAFVVSNTAFFSNVTVPGNVTGGNLAYNPNFNSLDGGPYHSFGALPVELSKLRINNYDNKVFLTWSTATEVQNYGWEIERSKVDKSTNKASSWQSIGFVKGAGNSNSPKEYSFVDNSALYGEYAYRLKQIDIDGSTSYSDELRVFVGKKPEVYDVKAFPNPFNPETKIRFELPEAGNVKLSIYDLTGRLITTLVDEYLYEGIYEREFNGSNLSSGIYFTILQSKDVRIVRKMQLIK